MFRKYTLEDLKIAVSSSYSKAQALRKLRIKDYGGNYRTINKAIKRHNIDISHFKGQAINKGKIIGPKRHISDYLNNKHPIASCKLKKRLIKEGLMDNKCSHCLRSEWMGQSIPTELDHINGDHFNNNLSNLRILCPNCHALTPTYKGRNIRITKKSKNLCADCDSKISKSAKRCKSCAAKKRPTKIIWPDNSELLEMVKANGYSKAGRLLGVSDNAIRKRLK